MLQRAVQYVLNKRHAISHRDWRRASLVLELRSEFVDRRSELMKLKMESTVAKKMETRQILPSEVPPVKVVVEDKESKKSFWDKLKIWQ